MSNISIVSSPFSDVIALASLTGEYLLKNYLTGMTLTGADNQLLPAEWYTSKVANAIARFEERTQIDVLKRVITDEEHDFHVNDYGRWGFIQLYRVPTLSVELVAARFPTGNSVQTYPIPWVQVINSHSQLHLVPTGGSLATVLLGQGMDFLTVAAMGRDYLPNFWHVDYTSGFDPLKIPRNVADVICKLACIDILQEMSDLMGALGVSSKSISIDGLSQSRSYLVPAFKARIDRYNREIDGDGTGKGALQAIRDLYIGVNLASI